MKWFWKGLDHILQKQFTAADITIGGNRPWDIRITSPWFYLYLLRGSVGFGLAYENGYWECNQLDEFFFRFLRSPLAKSPLRYLGQWWLNLTNALFNRQNVQRARVVGKKHYDLGNDLYKAMLDTRMTYTCGYWENAHTLDEAQEHKLRLICEKLQLKPGDRLLDIGCGWGGLAKYAAENYGVSVHGITISREQVRLARETCAGLLVEIHLMDYRHVADKLGMFDKVVSVGMFEHVGSKNYRVYMDAVARCLKDDGLFLLHTIGRSDKTPTADPWIDTYIFPNGMVPSMNSIINAARPFFTIEDWHNFGPDYDTTLMAWYENFEKAWPELSHAYSEQFRRRFRYYLLSCAAAFRARDIHLWQVILTKQMLGGYRSIRS